MLKTDLLPNYPLTDRMNYCSSSIIWVRMTLEKLPDIEVPKERNNI
jgi:hypothetical protein